MVSSVVSNLLRGVVSKVQFGPAAQLPMLFIAAVILPVNGGAAHTAGTTGPSPAGLERLTEAESAAYNARQTAPPGQQPMGYPDQGAARPGGLLGQLFGGNRHGGDEHGGGYRRGGHH